MPRTRVPEAFVLRLEKKETALQAKILETIDRLGENPRHPSLQTHRVQGVKKLKVFEAYVDMKNRVTFHWVDGEIALLAHCNHDILKTPFKSK